MAEPGEATDWLAHWIEFIDGLSKNDRRKILAEIGVPVTGFRKGAKSIPDQIVRSNLEAAPGWKRGQPFLKWFRFRFASLVEEIENGDEDPLPEKIQEWLDKFSAPILRLALAIFRPEMAESWEPVIQEHEEQLRQQVSEEAINQLVERIDELKQELRELEDALAAAKRENQNLLSENRKLQRQERDLQQRFERSQAEAARKLAASQRETQKLQSLYQDLQGQLRRSEQENETCLTKIHALENKLAAYKNARSQRQHLFRLYQSMAQVAEDDGHDPDIRVLVVGSAFPRQMFAIQGKRVRFDGIEVNEPPDDSFMHQCRDYDKVIVLASCPYHVRLGMYKEFGAKVTEVASLAHVREEIGLGE